MLARKSKSLRNFMKPLIASLLLGSVFFSNVGCFNNKEKETASSNDSLLAQTLPIAPAPVPFTNSNFKLPANLKIPQNIKQMAKTYPDISVVRWKVCNVNVPEKWYTQEECSDPNRQEFTIKHWGQVKGIKIAQYDPQQPKSLMVFVKSQGCRNFYNQPQKEAWYQISGGGFAVKGKNPKAEIAHSHLMNYDEKQMQLFAESLQGGQITKISSCISLSQ